MTRAGALLALALGCMTTVIAAATPPQARGRALASYKQDLISILALRADADHLLGAALLARSLGSDASHERYQRLLQRAARADPDKPAVTWAALADCDAKAGNCPNDEALARLRKQAPDNAATWIVLLDMAARNGDIEAQRQALAKAAASTRYDDYHGALLQALAQAATSLPVPDAAVQAMAGEAPDPTGPASVQAFIAYGEAAAQPAPSFLPIMPLCDPDISADAKANAGACKQLAELLAWGSSPRARAAGLHLQQVLAEDDQARRKAEADMRDLSWQLRHYSRLMLSSFRHQKLALELLHLALGGGSKMSRMAALLHRHDIPLEAPAPAPVAHATSSAAAAPAHATSSAAAAPAHTTSSATAAPAHATSAVDEPRPQGH